MASRLVPEKILRSNLPLGDDEVDAAFVATAAAEDEAPFRFEKLALDRK